ncbi:hypothetical protein HGRIS_004692 [Hohenbuehelia grisea]|uniref:Programmed cell death protein 2 C-terminal domain-containing protein n=1 Tax=Hohenbuehelia grisea TaxID=104357 RepID=A0ABR3JCQ4_9AGAR
MAPAHDEEFSDSDDEILPEMEASVWLGFPDEAIEDVAETKDAAVSRIGGHPAFLPSSEPSVSSSQCKNCSSPMELLAQMYCPFPESAMDRALYFWGCARAKCQGKDGSVRAWRGLRYNEKQAAKLKQRMARKQAKEKARLKAEAAKKAAAPKGNPFSMQNAAANPNPFGFGDQVFGQAPAPPDVAEEDGGEESDAESDDSEASEESLSVALASTMISESPWLSSPSYPPIYLASELEHLPAPKKTKLPPGVQVMDPDEVGTGKDATWDLEAYENSIDMDNIFERFVKRVGYEPEQCIRYSLNGIPLPFSSDKVFETLFPAPPLPNLPVTKPDFKVIRTPKRIYTPSVVPPCPVCQSKRVFECQLMPNLINILRTTADQPSSNITDEERRNAVQAALKDRDSDEKRGMEWGTCMVFTCQKDCSLKEGGLDAKETWKEEFVLVQWDS